MSDGGASSPATELYEAIDVYRQLGSAVCVYRCLRLLSGKGYLVLSQDYYRHNQARSDREFLNEHVIERLLQKEAPQTYEKLYSTLEEAIAAWDEEWN